MLQNNLKQFVNEPTRVTPTSATCIDLLFTNNNNFTLNVNDLGISDHKSISYNFDGPPQIQAKPLLKVVRSLNNPKNISAFREELSKVDWNRILLPDNDIDCNYNIFDDKIRQILDTHIPKKTIKINKTHNKTWLTKGLKTSCKHKRLLKILVNQSKNTHLKEHYNQYSKTLKKCIKTSKKLKYAKEMNKSKNKTKQMWNIIKRISSKPTNTRTTSTALISSDGTITQCPLSVANTFNQHFASVGRQQLGTNGPSPSRGRAVITPAVNSMFLKPVTQKEVFNIIKKIPNKRSCGIDDIPPTLLKTCSHELTPPLTSLINKSFAEGKFPSRLKTAIIKPILKKGGKSTDPGQYRPIVLLPTFSKPFEKAIANQITKFMTKYHILDNNQYGFRENRSTTLAIYHYNQEILNYLRDQYYAVGVLLDMSKAYDMVTHPILLSKLHGVGIRGIAYEWLRSYLSDRSQCVQLEHLDERAGALRSARSDFLTTNWSIPQGSVLGCILFLIYINDLPKICDTLCLLFADDISLLFKVRKNDIYDIDLITQTFNAIKLWLNEHNLKINNKKTKIIQFKPYQKQQLNLKTITQTLNIEEVNDFKLLGITIDTHLNWKKHIQTTKSKISQFIYALNLLKINTSKECALSAYYAYAYAWLKYGIIMWGHSVDANDLFVSQKKCLRIIVNIGRRDSCKPYFIKERILSLPSLYIFEACLFIRKNMNLFDHDRNPRRKNQLALPVPRLEIFRNGPQYRCIQIYNKLPSFLKDENNINTFKNKLRSLLIQKCYYSIDEYVTDKHPK